MSHYFEDNITKQSVSELANKIVEANYVEKRPDPHDKRSQQLIFSERGEQLIISTAKQLQSIEHNITKQIGNDAFAQLSELSLRLMYCLGGNSPQATDHALDDNEKLTPFIDDWIKLLLIQLQKNTDLPIEQIFTHSPQGFQLNAQIIQYLGNRAPIKLKKSDEERIQKTLNSAK